MLFSECLFNLNGEFVSIALRTFLNLGFGLKSPYTEEDFLKTPKLASVIGFPPVIIFDSLLTL